MWLPFVFAVLVPSFYFIYAGECLGTATGLPSVFKSDVGCIECVVAVRCCASAEFSFLATLLVGVGVATCH